MSSIESRIGNSCVHRRSRPFNRFRQVADAALRAMGSWMSRWEHDPSSGRQGMLMEPMEPRCLLSAVIYGCDANGELFTVNTATGQTHVIGNMGAVMSDIAENSQGQLYAVDFASELYRVDSTTATATPVGSLGTSINSLVFSSNGTLYAANTSLYTVNAATGAATLVGSLGGYSSDGDVAFDNHGNLFLSTTNGTLARVNTFTGQATEIGSFDTPLVYGMAYGSDEVMYGLSDATDQVLSINLATGTGTVQSTMTGISGVNGAASLPPQTTYAQGLDVSDNNGGRIKWSTVAADGMSFVFAKAAQGTTSTDSTFAANAASASAAHLLVGAYDFADPYTGGVNPKKAKAVAGDADEEADHFIKVAGKYVAAGYMQPALDLEPINYGKRGQVTEGGFGPNWTWSEIGEWTTDWISRIQQDLPSLRLTPILYMDQSYAVNVSAASPALTGYPLWDVDISNTMPSIGNWSSWTFLQNNQSGTLAGIRGNVDLDDFNSVLVSIDDYLIVNKKRRG